MPGQLGTGRYKHRVLIGDNDDARTAHFYFESRVRHNWPSYDKVTFANGKFLNISSPTIAGRPVYIFEWNELIADLWYRQQTREKILSWVEVAKVTRPGDLAVLADLLVEENRAVRPHLYSYRRDSDSDRINLELRKLSLRQLNQFSDLLVPCEVRLC